MIIITVYILLQHFLFTQSQPPKNWTLSKMYIPKTIEDIQAQIKDEHYINPKSQREFDTLIAGSEHFLPNFDEDIFKRNSKRFDKLKAIYEIKKKNNTIIAQEDLVNENILRQKKTKKPSRSKDERKITKSLQRAFALMTQFVYAARYKLAYGQVLRNVYKGVLEYKIGYCFALMRDIRTQEMLLYSTMHFNYQQHKQEFYTKSKVVSYADFQSYVQVYEKICKLDVNMMDTVNLAQKFINIRVTSTTPHDPNATTVSTPSTTPDYQYPDKDVDHDND